MRLMCDEMLQGLARWLRAAGYDTELARGLPDRAVIARCIAEQRVLITRDRHLASIVPGEVRVVLARGDRTDSTARALGRDLPVDWLRAPFTRCLIDNAPLAPADRPSSRWCRRPRGWPAVRSAHAPLVAASTGRAATFAAWRRGCGYGRRIVRVWTTAARLPRSSARPWPVRAAARSQRGKPAGCDAPPPAAVCSRRE